MRLLLLLLLQRRLWLRCVAVLRCLRLRRAWGIRRRVLRLRLGRSILLLVLELLLLLLLLLNVRGFVHVRRRGSHRPGRVGMLWRS